ncbi:hypothetical protein PVK06_005226 [Gossypium arboreum]|uniref:Uncharacterized protein n=1 Tax=Gossypium arboreum TaxID=29729 RepID=A0ABR0QV26_GOSAR|nr:hypothetical protein PVK06_005226 [Gossypium arboreum]
MEPIDDKDMETIVALYCRTRSNQNARIQLFVELASVKPTEDPTPLDLDATHAAEFPEYPEILPAHRLAINSNLEELFMGQRFESKEKCVFSIKRYIMNISVDYNVVMFKPTLYIEEC